MIHDNILKGKWSGIQTGRESRLILSWGSEAWKLSGSGDGREALLHFGLFGMDWGEEKGNRGELNRN